MDDMTRRQDRRPNGAESQLLTVRMPKELHAKFKEAAERKGETVSAAVVAFAEKYVKS